MSSKFDGMARNAHRETLMASDTPWASLLFDPPRSANTTFVMEDYLPTESILASYANQWYRFSVNGQHFAIRPQNTTHKPLAHYWPKPTPVPQDLQPVLDGYIIGYLHPNGSPSPVEDISQLRREILSTISGVAPTPLDVVAIQRDSQWLEPMVLIHGITEEKAQEIATHMGQRFFVQISKDWLRVYDTEGNWRHSGAKWNLTRLNEPPCPMSIGYEVSEKPTNPGGPYVSRSMVVWGQWVSHHAFTHSLLDCTPCDTTATPINSTTQGEKEHWLPASRFSYIKAAKDYLGDQEIVRAFDTETPTKLRGINLSAEEG